MAVSVKQDNQATSVRTGSTTSLAERIESVKAGGVSALATGLAYLSLIVLHFQLPNFPVLSQSPDRLSLLISVGVALASGFLFGITYRYIIREDNNPHLKSGAVLAFGLVRGLAQVDVGLNLWNVVLPFVLVTADSIFLFAIARFIVDWALHQGWIKPFRSN